ncbi:MAG: hypothetical protein JO112_12305 [Planctomycetes bacterium]|nr:hypothetical protein [Planctomycetota bacterium]
MMCRHCGRSQVNRPRGLCWSCYYTPGVRELYPSTSKFARRGIDDFNGQVPLPAAPTEALPGTPEKVAILEQRAHLRQALWHPEDAPAARARRLLHAG